MEFDKKALDYLDLEVAPREPTEEEHLDTLAFIAACKDYKKKREEEINGTIEFDKKALDNLDIEVVPCGFTEEDRIAVRAHIAAHKEREEKQEEINKRKRKYESLVESLYMSESTPINEIIREPENVDFVIEPHEVTEEEHLAMVALIAAHKEQKKKREKEINKRKRKYEPLVANYAQL